MVQVGERSIVGGRPGTCDADCPIPYVACPSGGSEADATTCTGAGRCLSNIGMCDCFEGYVFCTSKHCMLLMYIDVLEPMCKAVHDNTTVF
jgi:hypothetical protein